MTRYDFFWNLKNEFELNEAECMKLDWIALVNATSVYEKEVTYSSEEHREGREVLFDTLKDEPEMIGFYLNPECQIFTDDLY